MKKIYKPPNSDLTIHKGIDGKTCPVCKENISWKIVYFKSIIPNTYKCPNCKEKLRYNINRAVGYILTLLVLMFLVLVQYYFDKVVGVKEDELVNYYFIYGVLPFLVIAIIFTEYCRKSLKLVQK